MAAMSDEEIWHHVITGYINAVNDYFNRNWRVLMVEYVKGTH